MVNITNRKSCPYISPPYIRPPCINEYKPRAYIQRFTVLCRVVQTFMCLQVQYEMNWFSTSVVWDFITYTIQGRLSTVTAGTCMTKQISRLWIKDAVYNLHTIIKNMERCIGKLHFYFNTLIIPFPSYYI